MLPDIVLVRRQSPPWKKLAAAFRLGTDIDPIHYLPATDLPGFPPAVPHLIAEWNRLFPVNYFECRAVLEEIAHQSNSSVADVVLMQFDAIAPPAKTDAVYFFHDDDDIFDHNLRAYLPDSDLYFDIVVAPLFRFHSDLFTFVRSDAHCDLLLGRRENFHFRYQTNNYGIYAHRMRGNWFREMKDHVEASTFADKQGLVDYVISRPLSATFKTVWSASMLPVIAHGRDSIVAEMNGFRAAAERSFPPEYHWLENSISRINKLIEVVQTSTAPTDLHAIIFS